MKKLLVICLIIVPLFESISQKIYLEGKITDKEKNPIHGASIQVLNSKNGVFSLKNGTFKMALFNQNKVILEISHINFELKTLEINPKNKRKYLIILEPKITNLGDVTIEGTNEQQDPNDSGIKVDAKAATDITSASGDFTNILLTLPGVTGNNELSSAYNVRGGNFDENLVYVNEIPIYRPFLSNAGRQEGMSFVNPNLVKNINFYAGGWEAKYGDKLSSVLDISYKNPNKREGKMEMGFLGGSAFYGDKLSKKINLLLGIRHRDSRYLLRTLQTKGEYFPKYTDIQSLLTINLTGKKSNQTNKTVLQILGSISSNRYLTIPKSQVTDFGTLQKNLRIETEFNGREELNYDTYQSGFNLSHRWSNYFVSRFIGSYVQTTEQEHYEVEGKYRLCDISSESNTKDIINKCAEIQAIGGNYNFGRNRLRANILNAQIKNEVYLSAKFSLAFGLAFQKNDIKDKLKTYNFIDSAQFIHFESKIRNQIKLNNQQFTGYAQLNFQSKDSVHNFKVGVRTNHHSLTKENLISPRFQYSFFPKWKRKTVFKVSIGKYIQTPFYREFRDKEGKINYEVKSQKSMHYIAGLQRIMEWWSRPFYFSVDAYYKQISDLNPYDVDNVRMRYFAKNDAKAYAYGVDCRVNGEFVKGTQSWFSLGYLQSKEDIKEDTSKYVRRPVDQRINLAVYFEDHLPNDPTLRIYVNGIFGTGFPAGPPDNIDLRTKFNGDNYYRLDIGISKSLGIKKVNLIKNMTLRLEILNALGAVNTLSYSWIKDVNGRQLAIPNSLSARFLNLKFSVRL